MQGVIVWSESPFFQGIAPQLLERVGELVQESPFDQGQTIFREGDLARELYLLKSGVVELNYQLPTRPDITVRITKVQPGEVFAWSALTGGDHLTANATALESCEVFTIDASRLVALMDEHPLFGYQIMNRLSMLVASRLKDTRKQLQWLQST